MRMNNGQFGSPVHYGRPGGSYQTSEYTLKLLEQQTNILTIPAGVKSWVRSKLMCVKDLPEYEIATGGR